jgi:hypothetical protein
MKVYIAILVISFSINVGYARAERDSIPATYLDDDRSCLPPGAQRSNTVAQKLWDKLQATPSNDSVAREPDIAKGAYIGFAKNTFGYGIPWSGVVDETSVSNGIVVQNSFPKGDGYIDRAGNKLSYRIFWTRVINETDTPFELTISFPSDSFTISASPEPYFKLFLPPDAMTLDKVFLYDYGATGLRSFLETGSNTPTMLRKTIEPKGEHVFYMGALVHQIDGVLRAGLVVKEQTLYYRINLLDPALIPCGKIVVKKLER